MSEEETPSKLTPARMRLADASTRAWASLPAAVLAAGVQAVVLSSGALFGDDSSSAGFWLATLQIIWIVFGLTYWGLTEWVFRPLDHDELMTAGQVDAPVGRSVAKSLNEKIQVLLVLGAAVAALVSAIVSMVLDDVRSEPWSVALSIVTVAVSWIVLSSVMATSYMETEACNESATLEFDGVSESEWTDFVDASHMITASLAAPQVAFKGRPSHAVHRNHQLLAFLFNTTVVAILVSLLVT